MNAPALESITDTHVQICLKRLISALARQIVEEQVAMQETPSL
jgi:hypothetical protein